MAQEYFTLITLLGQAKIAAAIANSASLNLSEIAVGDGEYTPTEGQTALVSEQYRAAANTIERETNDPSIVRLELVIPAETGGFTIREFGVFDSDGDLFAVGNLGDTYKPTFEQGSGKEIVIRIRLQISSQANVTLLIDPAVVMASREYVDTELSGHKDADPAHPAANISYDNTTSGLEAADVQVAIDAVNAAIEAGLAALTAAMSDLSETGNLTACFIETHATGTQVASAVGWNVQQINTQAWNNITGCSLSAANYRIFLPEGDYVLKGEAIHFGAYYGWARFYSVTRTAYFHDVGVTAYSAVSDAVSDDVEIEDHVTIQSGGEWIQLHHYATFAYGAGFCYGTSRNPEVPAKVFIRKTA